MGKKVVRSILLAVLIAGTVVLGVGCAIALPALDPSKLETPDGITKIYSVVDPNAPAIELQADKGKPVNYSALPNYVKQAIIATEDRDFYEHNGVNYKSIARAIYRDVLAGGKVEGGSTITQQLAKNALLNDPSKTFSRKLQEIALAIQIERNYTKEDILEMYMNKVNFHPSILGIEAASEIYFGKPAERLTLGEAAFLAGLPQAPSYYYSNLDAALKRREIVLDNMVKEGYITQEQAEKAKKEPVDPKAYKERDKQRNKLKYPHYVEYVLEEAAKQYGIPQEQVWRGGLNIYTYLDPKSQEAAEKEFQNPANFPRNAKDGTRVEGAMVIVDPKTGGIRAMVGGRDTNSFMNYNRAFQMQRPPGSSIKPVLVYAPAIETGKYGPNSMLLDKKGTVFPGGYAPKDWDNHTLYPREQVTMVEALKQSWNIPAVWLLQQIGIDTGKKFAQRAGIPFDQADTGLGIALGGFTNGVSPLNMADAYQAFDNRGVRIQAHAIQKITTSSDAVLAQENPSRIQVMKESTANTMTSLLQVVVEKGTGTNARMSPRPVAGKTGTTEFGSNGNADAWFVGYTPELVGAVWMGFNETDNSHYLAEDHTSGYPAALFRKVMTKALEGTKITGFQTAPAQEEKEEKKEEPKPIQLSGEWTGKTVMLKWTPAKDGAQYAVFRVENPDNPDGGPLIITTDTLFVDTDVQPGKIYYYAISAVDPATNKPLGESNKISVKTGEAKPKPDDKPKDPAQPPTSGSGGTGGTSGSTNGGSTSGGTGGTGGTSGGTNGGSTSGGTGGTGGGTSGGTSGGSTGGGSSGGGSSTGGSTGGTGGTGIILPPRN
ncbi:transglycosylase domain-containing protein [Effusibacillus pohliae]|uniref:transglycosylase domain-containing protein n=1 Tax=Effusibacillus pohliae TaxID=232270 RepID=UPI000378D1A4|nr:PBP1A family penicillin-binding protein [Effusibacillus pohliae]